MAMCAEIEFYLPEIHHKTNKHSMKILIELRLKSSILKEMILPTNSILTQKMPNIKAYFSIFDRQLKMSSSICIVLQIFPPHLEKTKTSIYKLLTFELSWSTKYLSCELSQS